MRADHAALLANAVRDHLWSDLEVCPPTGGWRTVRGDVMKGGAEQQVEGFSAGFEADTDELHLDPMDWAPAQPAFARPTKDWWARYTDELGQVAVRRIAAPFRMLQGGRFMVAPLKPVDPADAVPA